jgi:hypothetical protein
MNSRFNRYFATSLFGLAIVAAGCAARDVDVRSPIRGESTVEGDSSSARGRGSSATTGSQTDRSTTSSSGERRSGTASGSASGSGSVSGSGSGY